ncbi:MAG: urate hydroxylase PuuD [Sphingobium sp.]|nr:urate hydroxylase PuuD [Sphingobium sp.]
MPFDLPEWFNLALRWLHLTAGIAWIGSSFYFIALDNHLRPPKSGEASGESWSVHGGGFYHKQKYMVAPSQMPDELHWSKWEAYTTWLSGFSLLVLIYFFGAKTFLIDASKASLTPVEASGIGLATLVVGWIFYDVLCRLPTGRSDRAVGVVWFVFLVGAAYVLNGLFNPRGAYLLIGAMVGTVMVANVFFIIIPNQKKAVNQLIAGETPDPALGKAGKQRSLHNNYMTLPVLFIMISHHYPMTYGADRPWLVLALLSAIGVAIRHAFNLHHRGQDPVWTVFVACILAVLAVSYVSQEKAVSALSGSGAKVTFADVAPIFAKHCVGCHGVHPTNPAFTAPPLGALLDSYDHASALAPKIKTMAVDSEAMPLGNMTGMTKEERAKLGGWITAGTPK